MHIILPHRFSEAEAMQRIKMALGHGRKEMEGKVTVEEERWDGNTLHFAFTGQGQHVSGTLEVNHREFVIDAKLPFMLRLFEGQIEKAIGEQAKRLLDTDPLPENAG